MCLRRPVCWPDRRQSWCRCNEAHSCRFQGLKRQLRRPEPKSCWKRFRLALKAQEQTDFLAARVKCKGRQLRIRLSEHHIFYPYISAFQELICVDFGSCVKLFLPRALRLVLNPCRNTFLSIPQNRKKWRKFLPIMHFDCFIQIIPSILLCFRLISLLKMHFLFVSVNRYIIII